MVRASRALLPGLVCLPLIAGCYARYEGDLPSRVLVRTMVVGVVVAGESRYYEVGPGGMKTPIGRAPAADPTRRINVQDCSRPIDPSAGNLMCR